MGKLIVWNVMSVDGYFEGAEPWDLSFHQTIWGTDLEALSQSQLAEAHALLFGRRTYEGMAAYWMAAEEEDPAIARAMNAIPKFVVTRTLDTAIWTNSALLGADWRGELAAIRRDTDKPIYLFGSAELMAGLLDADLVDELRIGVAPVLLGAGTRLFPDDGVLRNLSLAEARPLDSGGVLLRYTLPSS